MTDRLTRTELSWLLMQEARHAAKKLRSGVGLVATGVGEPEIRDLAPPSEDTGGVEATLDGLDAAMSTLSSLYGQPAQPRGKRGRIDIAALVWEVALEDGSVAAIVPSNEHAHAVIASGRAVNVYTLDEVARLLLAFPALVKAKQVFPGATVTATRRTIGDPLDGIVDTADPLDDPVEFA